ncbi:hypothetical protein BCR42DRAFT_409852 [Absidia repens]|uniref:Uncharacterized protein n=1 Tax=Absidia repens TaxID=90262 RepID=A0A1X2INA1_9FUNG|nr:hypothetical protein BCR42DRAFT_409852 [Absidia repens]
MENKKFMLGDDPKSYPLSPPSHSDCGHEEQRTTSLLPSATLSDSTVPAPHSGNNGGKRPIRHFTKRRSSGVRYMKRSTSMEDTSKARMRRSPSQQRLQSLSPMPIMTQLSSTPTKIHHKGHQQQLSSNRNASQTSLVKPGTTPSSFIVSSTACAEPIAQTFHATAETSSPQPSINIPPAASTTASSRNEPSCSSATKALLFVSASSSPSSNRQKNKLTTPTAKPHRSQQDQQQESGFGYQRHRLISHFIQQQHQRTFHHAKVDDDNHYQKIMDDQYRNLQQYHHPTLTSLIRCLAKNNINSCTKQSRPLSTPPDSSPATLLVFATTSEATRKHQRHHSHTGDYTITGQSQQQHPTHADQRHTIHKNHLKKILLSNDDHHYHHHFGGHSQQGLSVVSTSDFISPAKRSSALSVASSSASTASPWITSIWDRVWSGLIKT